MEIGGSNGSLVKNFLSEDKEFSWTIIEPSFSVDKLDDRVTFVEGFFESFEFSEKYDTIIHSHVLEHVYNPLKFIRKIESLLDYGDNHYISIPNMRYWIERGYSNVLFFEHTYYLDELVLEYMLNLCGFDIVDVVVGNHSIFIRCQKKKFKYKILPVNFSYVEKNFENYLNSLQSDITNIKKFIGNDRIYLFGAHIFSQIILNLGISESQVINILDNDPKKQEKRLYGTNLIVKSPKCLENKSNPKVVLRGGIYTDEIKESILVINPTTIFL